MCNFCHFIVHPICRFCTRFSYTIIWKHSQFHVSVTEQLALEQLNDNYFKSLARSHPCRPPAKTVVLLHLFVFTRTKKNREPVIGFLLNFESEIWKNHVKSIKFSFILHNFLNTLHTFMSGRVPVYRSAQAWFHLCVTYIASKHASNYTAAKSAVISELTWFSKKATVA